MKIYALKYREEVLGYRLYNQNGVYDIPRGVLSNYITTKANSKLESTGAIITLVKSEDGQEFYAYTPEVKELVQVGGISKLANRLPDSEKAVKNGKDNLSVLLELHKFALNEGTTTISNYGKAFSFNELTISFNTALKEQITQAISLNDKQLTETSDNIVQSLEEDNETTDSFTDNTVSFNSTTTSFTSPYITQKLSTLSFRDFASSFKRTASSFITTDTVYLYKGLTFIVVRINLQDNRYDNALTYTGVVYASTEEAHRYACEIGLLSKEDPLNVPLYTTYKGTLTDFEGTRILTSDVNFAHDITDPNIKQLMTMYYEQLNSLLTPFDYIIPAHIFDVLRDEDNPGVSFIDTQYI